MESLFARTVPKRGRVVLMLAGSLVVHGGLVGIGALFTSPSAEVIYDTDGWIDPTEGSAPTPFNTSDLPTGTVESDPTATPESIDSTVSTPPPAGDDMPFSDPTTPTPRQRIAVRPAVAARTNATSRPTGPATTSSNSGPVSATAGNAPTPGTQASWYTPHPLYPAGRLPAGTGVTTVRIITDSTGRIASAVIVRSTGNAILDAHTVIYVREHWRGPANSSRTTEFIYQLR